MSNRQKCFTAVTDCLYIIKHEAQTVPILVHIILVLSLVEGPRGASIKPWLDDILYQNEVMETAGGITGIKQIDEFWIFYT